MGYIGKVNIDNTNSLIGSTLYGICSTAEYSLTKTVFTSDLDNILIQNSNISFINGNFESNLPGITIYIKFIHGNTAINSITTPITLQVGDGQALNIIGDIRCNNNTIISFTLDEQNNWVVNNPNTTYTFSTGTNNGTFIVTSNTGNSNEIFIQGLQPAAYKDIVSNISNNSNSDNLPTAAAVASYVQNMTGGLSGLTGAMHFRGISTVHIKDGDDSTVNPTIIGYDFHGNADNAGDVVLYDGKEFVWTGTTWELLGDEGSYALKSNTDTITEVSSFTANRLPTLTVTSVSVRNVTEAGSATTVSVAAGILSITNGEPPALGPAISIGSASDWDAGTQASLTTNNTTVVVPGT